MSGLTRRPDQAAGLLEQIAESSLDDDYYVVRTGRPGRLRRATDRSMTLVVLAVFALLVTVAAVQTRTDRPATARERQTLVEDVNTRKELLADREDTARELRAEVRDLTASVDQVDPAYEALRVTTADVGATGPGATFVATTGRDGVEGSVITDRDLQILVNGLWYAGAEAVAINGWRIGSLTSIRYAGGAITVNYKSIGPPYTVVALGDDETLAQRFRDNPSGRYWQDRGDDAGVRLVVTSSSQLTVPAAPAQRLTVTHATAIKGDS